MLWLFHLFTLNWVSLVKIISNQDLPRLFTHNRLNYPFNQDLPRLFTHNTLMPQILDPKASLFLTQGAPFPIDETMSFVIAFPI